MKKTIPILITVGLSLSLQAAVMFYEEFDYTGNGGHVDNPGAQWASPTGAGGNSFTGRITGTDINPLGRSSESAFWAFAGQNNLSNTFGTTLSIDEVGYVSYNFEINSQGGQTSALELRGAGLFGQFFNIGANGSGNIFIGQQGGTTSTGTALTADTEYFIVGAYIINNVGNADTYSLAASIFTSASAAEKWAAGVTTGAIVGNEWDISILDEDIAFIGNASPTNVLDSVGIRGSGTTYYDAIRVGTELTDVTTIPEPSSLFLVGGCLLGFLFMRRK